ncbi:MAG TPA: GDP-mannose 4,6-dehydratase [Vicinamibacterales bacterium]|nr:GDP-mannose 4,6-dehydratase [Vicinamibacterales bacterium]
MSGGVLVTGATGFAGGHLLEHLGAPDDVVAWARHDPPPALAGLARWETVDLLDRDSVRSGISSLKPRAVYHFAGVTRVDTSWADPAGALRGNVLTTHYLLDALRRAGTRSRVLVTGSATIYAAADSPIREDAPITADSPYAISKLAQEALALIPEDGLDVIVARAFNHTGPRQQPAFVASSVARQVALIERGALAPVLRVGNLDARRDLTDVRDVVRAYMSLVESAPPGQVYNVASGVGRPIRSIVETLVRLAAVQVRIEVDPGRLRAQDKPVLVGDAGRLRAATGWEPRISFEQTLRDLLDYWRATA